MKTDNAVFELPFRPPYEIKSAAAWLAAAIFCAFAALYWALPPTPMVIAMACCAVMAGIRGMQGRRRWIQRQALLTGVLTFLPWTRAEPLFSQAIQHHDLWMGYGFEWTAEIAEQAYHVQRQGLDTVIQKTLTQARKPARQTQGKSGVKNIAITPGNQGSYWLQALRSESSITMPLDNLYGHVLILGTTRSGKTRLFDNLISQAIMRNEPVIIIDPKGDHDLRLNAERACRAIGHPERFVYFHPAYPETSARLDPMRNYNRTTELASRVAALITRPEGGADPFAAFGWKILDTVVNAIHMVGERVSLVKIRRYIEGGIGPIALPAMRIYCEKFAKKEDIAPFLQSAPKGKEIAGYIRFYRQVLSQRGQGSSEIDGIISAEEHDQDHFGKMVAGLIPILGMLTSGPLETLLSPSPDAPDSDTHVITDTGRIIKNRQVLYVGLDSLSDKVVGTAIGAMILSDMAAVAGDRYNYGKGNPEDEVPVNLFVDEAAETLNEPLIQLMNKGGGARIRVNIATQTVADLEARLGSKPRAEQVVANANTVICLRVNDGATQKFIAESLPKTRVRQIQKSYGQNVGATIQETYGGGYSESLQDMNEYILPAALFGTLPPLHYFAKLPGGRLIKGRVPILEGGG